jgi:hypothetical protein
VPASAPARRPDVALDVTICVACSSPCLVVLRACAGTSVAACTPTLVVWRGMLSFTACSCRGRSRRSRRDVWTGTGASSHRTTVTGIPRGTRCSPAGQGSSASTMARGPTCGPTATDARSEVHRRLPAEIVVRVGAPRKPDVEASRATKTIRAKNNKRRLRDSAGERSLAAVLITGPRFVAAPQGS